MCTLTRSATIPWLHFFIDGTIPTVDSVRIDVGHLLTALSHRVDLPFLSGADQVRRIAEAGRALDLFNVPERLSLNDLHGNTSFVAGEIIHARRRIRADRLPTVF